MKKGTKLDKPLLVVMVILIIFGLIMILSASSMASYMRYDNKIYYYLKHSWDYGELLQMFQTIR